MDHPIVQEIVSRWDASWAAAITRRSAREAAGVQPAFIASEFHHIVILNAIYFMVTFLLYTRAKRLIAEKRAKNEKDASGKPIDPEGKVRAALPQTRIFCLTLWRDNSSAPSGCPGSSRSTI